MNRLFCLLVLWMIGLSGHAQLEQADLDSALVKGVRYLNALPESGFPSYNQRLLLVYIARQYRLPLPPSPNTLQLKMLPEEDVPVYQFYQRLIQKKFRPDVKKLTAYFHQTTGIQRIMIWGLYPERLPLDSQCLVAFETATGIRNIAHAALALRWSEEKSSERQKERLKHLYDQYAQLLLGDLLKENPAGDSGMEGIVGLEGLHRRNAINYRWIQTILQHQQADGGWAFAPGKGSDSNPHTTLLAIWIVAAMRSGQ